MEYLGNYQEFTPSIINDPFKQNCIESIRISMRKRLFGGGLAFEGEVEFKNGTTSGSQEFTGTDLYDVFKKVAVFCTNLKN